MAVQFRGRSQGPTRDFSVPFTTAVLFNVPQDPKPQNVPCCVWTVIAFILGVLVGVTLPYIYIVDKDSLTNYILHSGNKDVEKLNTLNVKSIVTFSDPAGGEDSPIYPVVKGRSGLNGNTSEKNIFFSSAVEKALPKGFSDLEVKEWRTFVRNQTVIHLHEGCGRMQNRLLTFSNGTLSCCRYRQNLDQIQGEIFSFYLSRILQIRNVPPATLGVIKARSSQWKLVDNEMALAQWSEDHPVVLTKFVENLTSVPIPNHFRSASRSLHPTDIENYNLTTHLPELVELAQWTDLLIFDYLTANLDRIVNNLYNLQWNPSMMEAPTHNLARQRHSKLLVFLDNESGLLHGYRLLDKYEPFHVSLLQSLCVFRRSTSENIKDLVIKKEVGKRLNRMFQTFDSDLQKYLPTLPEKTIRLLNERLKVVYDQIQTCQKLYSV